MAKIENIDWIFFDVGGVILDDGPAEIKRQEAVLTIARQFKPELTMASVLDAWMEASKLHGTVRHHTLRLLLDSDTDYKKGLEEFKQLLPHGHYLSMSQIRPEAAEILEQLSKHYQLGIIANQSHQTTDFLAAADVLKYFGHQKMSAHHGLEKPNPAYFEAVLSDTKANPERSVLVDDNWFRGLLPAQNLGMKTILFKRDCMPYPENAQPDHAVASLKELIQIFVK
jgi:HAD superfamily hydrolase (TIGR01509 family)